MAPNRMDATKAHAWCPAISTSTAFEWCELASCGANKTLRHATKHQTFSQSYQLSLSNLRAGGSRKPTNCANIAHDVNHQSSDICSMPPTPQSLPPMHCVVHGTKPLPSGLCIAAARIHSTCHAFSHTISQFLAAWATALNLFPTAWYSRRPLKLTMPRFPNAPRWAPYRVIHVHDNKQIKSAKNSCA